MCSSDLLPLENAPEALHWSVVNTLADAGHALRHTGIHQLLAEDTVGVLEPSVAVKQGLILYFCRVFERFHSQIDTLAPLSALFLHYISCSFLLR